MEEARHIFLAFESDAELRERATPLLTQGLERREMVVYASPEDSPDPGDWSMEALDESDRAAVSDLLVSRSLACLFGGDTDASPREPLASALDQHLDLVRHEGMSGLRIFGISTRLASLPHWGRWEYEVGRRTLAERFTAICAYDASALDREVLGDLAALHQELRSKRPITPFSLFPTSEGMALSGEVDAASADRLERALACVDPGEEGRVEIDISRLRFINHDGLRAIERFARDRQVRVRLVGASATVRRLHEILAFDHDRVEATP